AFRSRRVDPGPGDPARFGVRIGLGRLPTGGVVRERTVGEPIPGGIPGGSREEEERDESPEKTHGDADRTRFDQLSLQDASTPALRSRVGQAQQEAPPER